MVMVTATVRCKEEKPAEETRTAEEQRRWSERLKREQEHRQRLAREQETHRLKVKLQHLVSERNRELEPKLCAEARQQASASAPNPVFHAFAGRCLEQEGRHGEAIAAFRKAHAQDPRSQVFLRLLGAACHRQGKMDCAMSTYKNLQRLNRRRARDLAYLITSPRITFFAPEVKAEAETKQDQLVSKAVTDLGEGKHKPALVALRASLAEDVNHLPTLVNLSLAHLLDQDFRRASQYLDRALLMLKKEEREMKPAIDVLAVRLARAVLFHRWGSLSRSLDEYETLLQIKPDHEAALFGLGAVQSLRGRRNEALDTYDKLKKTSQARAKDLFAIIMRDG
jgi:tetratricopeptide (TPR) repeat protein